MNADLDERSSRRTLDEQGNLYELEEGRADERSDATGNAVRRSSKGTEVELRGCGGTTRARSTSRHEPEKASERH